MKLLFIEPHADDVCLGAYGLFNDIGSIPATLITVCGHFPFRTKKAMEFGRRFFDQHYWLNLPDGNLTEHDIWYIKDCVLKFYFEDTILIMPGEFKQHSDHGIVYQALKNTFDIVIGYYVWEDIPLTACHLTKALTYDDFEFKTSTFKNYYPTETYLVENNILPLKQQEYYRIVQQQNKTLLAEFIHLLELEKCNG